MLSDAKILVTGPAGQIRGFSVSPRTSCSTTRCGGSPASVTPPGWGVVEAAGVRTVAGDLASGDFVGLPDDFDHVLHLATFRTAGSTTTRRCAVQRRGHAPLDAALPACAFDPRDVDRRGVPPGGRPHPRHPRVRPLLWPTRTRCSTPPTRCRRSRRRPWPDRAPAGAIKHPHHHRPHERVPTARTAGSASCTTSASLTSVGYIVVKWDPAMYSPIHQDDINRQAELMLGVARCPPPSSTGAVTNRWPREERCAELGRLTGREPRGSS